MYDSDQQALFTLSFWPKTIVRPLHRGIENIDTMDFGKL